MKKIILSWLLHHANRSTKAHAFYSIKDKVLSRYGECVGYDLQKIDGKKCRSCGGSGLHARYSNTYPYKAYDWDTCWHCFGGWYRLPIWVCLSRIRFGRYVFHRPLRRLNKVNNPWPEISKGLPLINGYIEHEESPIGWFALLMLYCIYDKPQCIDYFNNIKSDLYQRFRWRWLRFKRRIKTIFTWETVVVTKPSVIYFEDPDLPF